MCTQAHSPHIQKRKYSLEVLLYHFDFYVFFSWHIFYFFYAQDLGNHSSHIRLFVTLRTVAHQAPLLKGFFRQEYWNGLPFPSPGDLLEQGTEACVSCISCITGGYFIIWATHLLGYKHCRKRSISHVTHSCIPILSKYLFNMDDIPGSVWMVGIL